MTLKEKLQNARLELSSAYDKLYEMAVEKDDYSDVMEKIEKAIDIIFEIEQKEKNGNGR